MPRGSKDGWNRDTSYKWSRSPMPSYGEWLYFKSPSHAVYDDFPWGNVVKSWDQFVDFTEAVFVYESRRDVMERYYNRRQFWVKCEYVAIQFQVGTRFLWTNFSRDGEFWMWTQSDMDLHASSTSSPSERPTA